MNKKALGLLFIIRISLGFIFLYSGITKFFDGFTAAGYLENATEGPFKEMFASLAGSTFVDQLVIWGEIGIGISLLFGILLKLGVVSGVLMMLLYYFSSFTRESGLINDKIMYALLLAFFGLIGGGLYGVADRRISQLKFIQNNKVLTFIFNVPSFNEKAKS